eukprot:6988609-Pyramimonas_sp.AAC.1
MEPSSACWSDDSGILGSLGRLETSWDPRMAFRGCLGGAQGGPGPPVCRRGRRHGRPGFVH